MARQRPDIHLMGDKKELLLAGVLREKFAHVCRLLRFIAAILEK